MERGVAVITGPEDWEKAAQHLWGLSLTDFAFFKSAGRRGLKKPSLRFRRFRAEEISSGYFCNSAFEEARAA
jgi:hypothetical protein